MVTFLGLGQSVFAGVPSDNPRSGDPAAIARGKIVYYTNCISCHGSRLNGQSRFKAGDLRKFKRGFSAFVTTVVNGRKGSIGVMPPWKKVLNEDQIIDVGTYVETFAIAGAKWTDN